MSSAFVFFRDFSLFLHKIKQRKWGMRAFIVFYDANLQINVFHPITQLLKGLNADLCDFV